MRIDSQLSANAVRMKRKCTSDERKYENINHIFLHVNHVSYMSIMYLFYKEGPKGFSVIHPSPLLSGGERGTQEI